MLLPPKYRQPVLLGLLLLSVLSLFVSRAGLSISLIAFVAITTIHRGIGAQLQRLVRTPVLLAMSVLFLVPLLSGLWSTDVDKWTTIVRIKLPLLFFPIAFAGAWQLSPRQWRILAWFFLACVAAGVAASLWGYLRDFESANNGFRYSRTFGTPLDNDHVRFSWLVSAAVLLLFVLGQGARKKAQWLLAALFVYFTIYLHVLAARTGLGAYYIILLALALRYVWRRRSLLLGIVFVATLAALPLIALQVLPSFRNRVQYIGWDLGFVRAAQYHPGVNDGNRFLSIRAGWKLLLQHPGGVGFGDIFPVTNAWYDANVPGMLESDRYYPSSEWLIYGLGAGWIGVILFTACLLAPLWTRAGRWRFHWLLLNIAAAFSFLFDIGLEVQYGVYLYVFLVLWWWKWLTPESRDYAE
ncbi:O-antigen ligase family protein [Flaviaesturariibacter terrae]